MNGRFTHAKATEDMDPYAVFSLNEMDVQKERLKTEIVTEALHMHDRYRNRSSLEINPRQTMCPRCAMFKNWLTVVRSIDDEKLLAMNGIDYTLYLVFLRYAWYLFTVLSVFGIIFLLGIYASGTPTTNNLPSSDTEKSGMDVCTVLNITGTQSKLAFVFFVAMFGVPLVAGFWLLKYRQLSKKLNVLKPHKVYNDIDLAYHTVMVKNLPTGVGV